MSRLPAVMGALPRITSSAEKGRPIVLVCPWCRQDVVDAQVRLGDLVEGWEAASPDWPERGPLGEATSALVVDCPSCAHPSMVALAGAAISDRDTRYVKLVPVRTAADTLLVGGPA